MRCKYILKEANVVYLSTILKYILSQKVKIFNQFLIASSEKFCLGENISLFSSVLSSPLSTEELVTLTVSDRLHAHAYHIFAMM